MVKTKSIIMALVISGTTIANTASAKRHTLGNANTASTIHSVDTNDGNVDKFRDVRRSGKPDITATDAETNKTGILDTSRVYDLDEIIVVSQPKEVLSLRRQPISSTVVTGRDLQLIGATDLSGLSAYVPSFVMPSYGSRLTSSVYVRGIGSRVNNPAVGIYVDGIPLVNKSSYNFHVYQTDRIDVLRGPQGTLYGINTEGGIVRLYTKSPMRHQATELHVGIGTHLTRNVEIAHYSKPNDQSAFSIAAYYNGSNGYLTNATTNDHADNIDEAGGKMRFILKPNKRLTADFTTDYQFTRQHAFAYGAFDTRTRTIDNPANNRNNTYQRNMVNTGLGITYVTDALTFNSQTSYQLLRDRMEMDQDYMPQDYMHLSQRQLMNALTEEFTVKSNAGESWRHSSGVFGSYQWLRTEAPVYFDTDFTKRIASGIQTAMHAAMLTAMANRLIATGMTEDAAYSMAAGMIEQAGGVSIDVNMAVPALMHTPQANIGIYHESNISLGDRLTATLGLRYDYCHTSIKYATSAAMTVAANVMGTQANNTLSSVLADKLHSTYGQLLPKLGLSLAIDSRGGNVYAVASKGYRAGGYNIQMFSDILQSELTANSQNAMQGSYDIPHTAEDYKNISNTITYKPEESWNFEIGAHLNIADGVAQADIAAYCMTIRNQQLSVMAADYGFGRMMVNAGRSRSLGVEAALRGSALDNSLAWAAAYALTSARFTEYDYTDENGVHASYEGKYVPFVPNHTLSMRADYRMPLGHKRLNSLTIGADLTAQGRIYWDEANTASQPFYALLGIHAGIQHGKLGLNVWCRNITGTHYATFAFSSAASGETKWFAQRGAPIQAGVEISLKL